MTQLPITNNLILYGPPGVGKTTLGRLVAEKLNYRFVDGDEWLENHWTRSVASYFENGEAALFRAREAAMCRAWSALEGCVLAPGGGALLNPHSRAALAATGVTLCLTASLDTLLARLADSYARPLLQADPRAYLAALLTEREALYNSFSLRLPTDNTPLDSLVEKILALYHANQNITHFTLPGSTALMGHGLLPRLPELLQAHHLQLPYVLISDTNTAPLAPSSVGAFPDGAQAGPGWGRASFPPGESSKTLLTVGQLASACLAHGLDRNGTLLALGGGVVGDVAGFVAATFMRGVRWANLPTTVLAMADASLGGKVGVDLPEGKNLVGAFHPPALILADFDTLTTLPRRETLCGLAEIIKSAIIADAELFARITSPSPVKGFFDGGGPGWGPGSGLPPAFITRAAAIKVGIVTADPYEKAERAKLNLGHTIGHGIEAASGYALQHGEAIAIGLVAEARLAETIGLAAPGLAAEIEHCLQTVGLPTRAVGLAPHAIRAAMSGDKKKSGGQLKFALPKHIGEVEFGIVVDEPALTQTLEALTHA